MFRKCFLNTKINEVRYTMEKQNEFEKMYSKDEFSEDSDDIFEDDFLKDEPDKDNVNSGKDIVDNKEEGLEYDISKASRKTKAPDRINLDGKEVVITDVKVILPKPESEWQLSKK